MKHIAKGTFYNREEYLYAWKDANRERLNKLAVIRNKKAGKAFRDKLKAYRKKNQRHFTLWQIEWNRKHPHSVQNSRLKSLYGITLDDYNQLLEEQNGKCAICSKSPEQNGKNLFVDHCHRTKKVRGLLCLHCNTTLGRMNDDPKLLLKAVRYLEAA